MIHHDDNFTFLYKAMDPSLETKKIGSGYTDGSAQVLRYFITRQPVIFCHNRFIFLHSLAIFDM